MSVPPHADEHELPPTVVAEHKTYRCEWCGRPLDASVEERELAADVGRKTHRYLPKRYRACDDTCRAGVRMFVRRHMALGPLLWSLTVLSFLVGVGALVSVFPPPLRLMMLAPDELLLLLALLGALGVLTGGLVTLLPYTFIARRPEGDAPTVPLRRVRIFNRILGSIMALFSGVVLVRVILWL